MFLSTDDGICEAKILEVYALRWGIEVYFLCSAQHNISKKLNSILGFYRNRLKVLLRIPLRSTFVRSDT